MQSLKFFKGIILHLENPQTPFVNIILTFIGAITLRNFLEPFSTKSSISLNHDIHYSIFYITVALSLIILFHFATREPVSKIARVILPCFILLSIVPITDLLLSFGQGYNISYLRPGLHHHMVRAFFLFWGPFEGQGVSPGQRIEIMLMMGMSFIYFFIKTDKLLRSLFFALLTYVIISFYLALPFVLKIFLNLLGCPDNNSDSNENMIRFYLLLILPISQLLFYLYNKKYFTAIWKDSRMPRILHFQLMVILGFSFFLNPVIKTLFLNIAAKESSVLLYWIFIPPAIVFAWLFSVMTNNIEDYAIDKISNPDRPTISKTIPMEHYKNISWIFLGLALTYASAVSFVCFFIILLWTGNYFLYSSPPWRLKKIPFFSKLVISFNSFLLFALGHFLCTGDLIPPPVITFFFLTCFTAVINFIDIKDYEGDKAAGIKTLPTILGLKKSQIIIGSFFVLTYGLISFVVEDLDLLLITAAIGCFIFWLINKKNYSEKPVFITYILSIVVLIVYFWTRS